MKQLLILTAVISLLFISCNKPYCDKSTPTSLNGKWRMITVKENSSGTTTTKPSEIPGEVDIVFTTNNAAGGTFTGKTPTNDIWQNEFFTGDNQSISIPVLSMTKVMETSWGNEFTANICDAETYHFENGEKLHIKTAIKTLTFKKLQ